MNRAMTVLRDILNNPVDARGEDIVMDKSIPFIWEIDNRDAFKIMGVPIAKMHGWKHILPQHNIECATEKRDLPNGNSFYLPFYFGHKVPIYHFFF